MKFGTRKRGYEAIFSRIRGLIVDYSTKRLGNMGRYPLFRSRILLSPTASQEPVGAFPAKSIVQKISDRGELIIVVELVVIGK